MSTAIYEPTVYEPTVGDLVTFKQGGAILGARVVEVWRHDRGIDATVIDADGKRWGGSARDLTLVRHGEPCPLCGAAR